LTKYDSVFALRGYRPSKGTYIGTITTIGQRNQPHDKTSKYKRTGQRNNRVDLTMYVTEYPGDMTYHAIIQDQMQIGDIMFKGVLGNPDRMTHVGKTILTSTSENGTAKWIIDNKGGPEKNQDRATETVRNEVVECFRDGLAWRNDVKLDHLMVDYDIKQFLVNHVGCTSWNSLDDTEMRNVFANFPTKTVPNWDILTSKGY
jgi:hypothetical protein